MSSQEKEVHIQLNGIISQMLYLTVVLPILI